MKRNLITTMSLIFALAFVACSSDPGSSYIKNGEYLKAVQKYDEAISDEYASSGIIPLTLKKAIALAKIPNATAAWAEWKRAQYLNSKISQKNSKKKAYNEQIAEAAKTIKNELDIAAREAGQRTAAAYEKQKPQIYQRAVQLQEQGNDAAAIGEFRKIPNYRDTNARIEALNQKLKVAVERMWQQGFSLFSAESYSRAIRIFDEILAIDPAHKNAQVYKQKSQEKLKALRRF